MAQAEDPLRSAINEYLEEEDDWQELTPVLTEAVQTALKNDRDSHPESEKPLSGFAVAWGSASASSHGRTAVLVALLLAVCFIAWLIVTHRPTPTPAPSLPPFASASAGGK